MLKRVESRRNALSMRLASEYCPTATNITFNGTGSFREQSSCLPGFLAQYSMFACRLDNIRHHWE